MATLLKGSWYSLAGEQYEVRFDKGSPSGTSNVVKITDAKYSYKSNIADIDANFLLSNFGVSLLIENATQDAIFRNYLDGDETNNRIRVIKNGVLEYVGLVIVDMLVEEDRHFPRLVSLEATDSIARLKNVEYTDEGLDYDNYTTVTDHIKNVLVKAGVQDYYPIGDELFRIHSTFWPDQLTPDDNENCLDLVRVGYKAFRTVDNRGNVVYKSAYDVLLEICKAFNLRFLYSSGKFILTEIADYDRQGAPIVYHQYDIAGTKLGTETYTSWAQVQSVIGTNVEYTGGTADALVLAGGTQTRVPPLRAVKVNYKHFSRQNLLPGRTWTNIAPQPATLFNFRSAAGLSLRLSGVARLRIVPPGGIYSSGNIAVILKLQLFAINNQDQRSIFRTFAYTAGVYQYTTTVWSNDILERNFPIACPFPSVLLDTFHDHNFVIDTPDVPISGNVRVNFVSADVLLNGQAWQGATVAYEVSNVFLESIVDGSIASQLDERLITVRNENYESNSQVLDREVIIGDGITPNSFGRIEALVGTVPDTWTPTTAWRRYSNGGSLTGGSIQHVDFIGRVILALQDTTRRVLNSSLIAPSYYPEQPLLRGTGVFIIYQGEKDLLRDEWRGQWKNISFLPRPAIVDIQDIAIDPQPSPTIGTLPPTGTPPPGGNVVGTNTTFGVLDDPLPPDVEVTNPGLGIPPSDINIFAGDILILTNPETGVTQEITVANDYAEGVLNPWVDPDGNPWLTPGGDSWIVDSTLGDLQVEPFTPTTDFPAGSYLQIDPVFLYNLLGLTRKEFERFDVFLPSQAIVIGVADFFWRPVQRVGFTIEGLSIAVATNNASTIQVQLKYEDLTNSVFLLADVSMEGLTAFYAMNTVVQQGRYFFDIISGSGTGLQITLQLRKNIVSNE